MVDQLGTHLVRKGLLSQSQLDEALKSRLIYGGSLGTNLVELGLLELPTLGQALSDAYHFPLATEAELESVSSEAVALLKPELARQHQAFPLAVEGRRLRIALAEPQDPRHVDSLAFATGMRIVPSIIAEPRLWRALEKRYGLPRPTRPARAGQARPPAGQGAVPGVALSLAPRPVGTAPGVVPGAPAPMAARGGQGIGTASPGPRLPPVAVPMPAVAPRPVANVLATPPPAPALALAAGTAPAFSFGAAASFPHRPPGLIPRSPAGGSPRAARNRLVEAAEAPTAASPRPPPPPLTVVQAAPAEPVVEVRPPPPPPPEPESEPELLLEVVAEPETVTPPPPPVEALAPEPPAEPVASEPPVVEGVLDDAPIETLTEKVERDIRFESALADILRPAEPVTQALVPVAPAVEVLPPPFRPPIEPEVETVAGVKALPPGRRLRTMLDLPALTGGETSGELSMASDLEIVEADSGSSSWESRCIEVDFSGVEPESVRPSPVVDFIPDWDPSTEFSDNGSPGVQWVQLADALDAVQRATTPGELGQALLSYAQGRFPRGFLLGETFGSVRVGQAFGPGSEKPEVAALQVSLSVPSILSQAQADGGPVVSSKPLSQTDEVLFAALGETYSNLLAAPIRVRQRAVGFVVIDGGPAPFGPEELDEMERLLAAASEAYGRLQVAST
ncbi:hypothetical protein [Melittangium boletus]|uniref:GspE/PulE/PilB domain-containing protein n=1 Tax=Melittangium boletus TaxID=83453 RepID=UPI003DA57644